jgi:hypothetical protein
MKKTMAFMCIILMALTLISETQAQRDRNGENRRRRGGETRRDNDRNRGGSRDRRGPIVDRRDRNDRRGPIVDRDRRDNRDYRDRRDNDYRGPGRDSRYDRGDRDYRRDDSRNRRVDRHRRYRHRPDWRNPGRTYTRYRHTPRRDRYVHSRRYTRRYDYHRTIPYRFVYWDRWIRYRADYGNGYVLISGYPFFVYNGYRHRYSSYDYCDYDLVDGYNNTVERTFYGYTCQQAYDYCAELRDDLNYSRYDYRYFCSESLDFSYGDFDHWSYEDDFYYDVY